MIEHTVKNDLHTSLMRFVHESREELVACFEIGLVGNAPYIHRSVCIIAVAVFKQPAAVIYDNSEMRVYMIVILRVIFVI